MIRPTKKSIPENPSSLALLLRMKDGKEYLIPQENLLQVVEFAKTFEAEIYQVNIGETKEQILSLAELPAALCNADYQQTIPYTCPKKVIPSEDQSPIEHEISLSAKIPMTPSSIREQKKAIRSQIRTQLLNGNVVEFNTLCSDFPQFQRSVISALFHVVRTKLQDEGYNVVRVSSGCYQIQLTYNNTMYAPIPVTIHTLTMMPDPPAPPFVTVTALDQVDVPHINNIDPATANVILGNLNQD